MAQCSPVTRGATSHQRSHPFADQRAHGLPQDLASGQMIEVLTRQPLPPPACQKKAGRTHEMFAFRGARSAAIQDVLPTCRGPPFLVF
jgi:hypothetical protein